MNQSTLNLIKSFEGFSATPYPDAGKMAIGYGHQIRAGENLSHVSPDQAEALLAQDAGYAESLVNSAARVPLTQSMRDALTSLAFNTGQVAPTLYAKLNAGDYQGAADQFDAWVYSQGQVNNVLVGRRAQEKAVFLSEGFPDGNYQPPAQDDGGPQPEDSTGLIAIGVGVLVLIIWLVKR